MCNLKHAFNKNNNKTKSTKKISLFQHQNKKKKILDKLKQHQKRFKH